MVYWNTLLLISVLGFLGGLFGLSSVYRKKEKAYKRALEINQKRLDQQVSKLNILVRSLPNIQSLLVNSLSSDSWKTVCLDEARAFLQADGGRYWRYQERDQKFECDVSRGSISPNDPHEQNPERVPPGLEEAAKHRTGFSQGGHTIFVPLLVENRVWGVFSFHRQERDDGFIEKDLDMASMFVKQLALSLENQALIANRDKFYLELVQALADTLDSRNASTEGQTRRARALAREIGREMGLPEEFISYLEYAALMHDIGNIAIDEALLKKPGKLTPEEFAVIKKHPELGYKILAPVSLLAPVAPMVLYHQEWFNGKGYPEGLRGEEIPLGARIVAVLDAWGAMTSPRPWRKALSREQAKEEIKKGTGSQFDPKVVEAFFCDA